MIRSIFFVFASRVLRVNFVAVTVHHKANKSKCVFRLNTAFISYRASF